MNGTLTFPKRDSQLDNIMGCEVGSQMTKLKNKLGHVLC